MDEEFIDKNDHQLLIVDESGSIVWTFEPTVCFDRLKLMKCVFYGKKLHKLHDVRK